MQRNNFPAPFLEYVLCSKYNNPLYIRSTTNVPLSDVTNLDILVVRHETFGR